jgi:hypothetical protein
MGTFKSSRTFPYTVEDLQPVAQDVIDNFEQQAYEVTAEPIPTGGWQVSVRKGGIFKTIAGLKTSLNIKIEPMGNGTMAEAGIGVFGAQAIPTAITLLVFWPLLFVQIWGLAQSSGLDEEAMSAVERSLAAHSEGDANSVRQWLPPQEQT